MPTALVRVSITVKRHHGHGNSYQGKYLPGWLKVSDVGPISIITMLGHSGLLADLVLETELRVLILDLQEIGSELRHWMWLEHL